MAVAYTPSTTRQLLKSSLPAARLSEDICPYDASSHFNSIQVHARRQNTHPRIRTHARTHTHTRTRTRTHTHAHAHVHAYTHTHFFLRSPPSRKRAYVTSGNTPAHWAPAHLLAAHHCVTPPHVRTSVRPRRGPRRAPASGCSPPLSLFRSHASQHLAHARRSSARVQQPSFSRPSHSRLVRVPACSSYP